MASDAPDGTEIPAAAPAPKTYTAPSARKTRGEATRWGLKGKPLQVGILGTSGSGKTTYQTALAYSLVRRLERDEKYPLRGTPFDAETRRFLDVRVTELVKGNFPLRTNESTKLTYRLDTGRKFVLTSILDYRGGDLEHVFGQDPGQTLPPTLQELANYFESCNAFMFLVNSRVLLMDNDSEDFEYFWHELLTYETVLDHMVRTRKRHRGRISEPFALVVTQCDRIDLTDPRVRAKLDGEIDKIKERLARHLRYPPEQYLTSAVGHRFLDPRTGKKLPNAILEPDNILAPIRFFIRTRDRHERRKRNEWLAGIVLVLVVGILLGAGLCRYRAVTIRDQVLALATGVPGLKSLSPDPQAVAPTAAEMATRVKETVALRRSLGQFDRFLTASEERAFVQVRDGLLRALDERAFGRVQAAVAVTPMGEEAYAELEAAVAAYLEDEPYGEVPRVRAHTREVGELLTEGWEAFDRALWTRAMDRDSVEGYNDYLAAVGDRGLHRVEAQRRLGELHRQAMTERWDEILAFMRSNPSRLERQVQLIHDFLFECPPEVQRRLTPSPQQLYNERLARWDEQLWERHDLYYQQYVESAQGASVDIQVQGAIERFQEDYLNRLQPFTTPKHAAEARARLELLRRVRTPTEYRVTLRYGRFDNYDEARPDIYVLVFHNDRLVWMRTPQGETLQRREQFRAAAVDDDARPRWNYTFTLVWQAYDRIRVEVWDAETALFGDDALVFQYEDAGITSLDRALGGTLAFPPPPHRPGQPYFAVTFELQRAE